MQPIRIQRRRVKGWRMPPNTVYVGRGSKWGNPFVVGKHGKAAECVELFALCLYGYLCISADTATVDAQRRLREAVRDDLDELEGKNLACWCRPDKPCHADVLLAAANQSPNSHPTLSPKVSPVNSRVSRPMHRIGKTSAE